MVSHVTFVLAVFRSFFMLCIMWVDRKLDYGTMTS